MEKQFRENKYLNESGSKKGNWYMNRVDYFQFHEYPEYKKHKTIALLVGIFVYFLGIKMLSTSFLIAILCFYIGYVALLSFMLLRSKTCRYRGYLFYPKKIVKFFKSIEIEVNLKDFDTIATMNTNNKNL